MKTSDFKKLAVWSEAINLTTSVYTLIKILPKEERNGLADQMRRCSISVPSNIAEGQGRSSKKEFLKFLSISRGSLCELETQLIIGEKLSYFTQEQIEPIILQCAKIGRMIKSLANAIESQIKRD